MNILNNVTIKSLKKNRVRTFVTIIGIILSTAMFTAVTTMCSSLYSFIFRVEIAQSGNYHVHTLNCSGETVKQAAEHNAVELSMNLEYVGYAIAGSQNPDKPYLCVLAADEAFFSSMPIYLTDGRLPENANELMLPKHLKNNGLVNHSIGEKLTLKLGERMVDDIKQYQHDPFFPDGEHLNISSERSYTVVGFYERPDFEYYSAPGYSALTIMDGEVRPDGVYEAYFRIHNPKKNLDAFIRANREILETVRVTTEYHAMLLMLEGYSDYVNLMDALTAFATILSIMIFAGSVVLIYSSFSISVSERTRQYGLLSSVGATRGQLRRSVFFEAGLLSVIAIPIGLLIGVAGIGITLLLCGDLFTSLARGISGVKGSITMRLSTSWEPIALAAALALVTTLVSAWIPALRAMRVTPIEAIRQSKDVKSENRSVRCSKLFVKLFGAEGVLAKKYYFRSRKKYRAAIISLAMSVILFISASAFTMYLIKSATGMDSNPNYDCMFYIPIGDFANARSAIDEQVDKLAAYIVPDANEGGRFVYIPDADATSEYRSYVREEKGSSILFADTPNMSVIYMDDASFVKLLNDNGIGDTEPYFAKTNPKTVLLNAAKQTRYTHNSRTTILFNYLKPGVDSLLVAKPATPPEGYAELGIYWTGEHYGEGELRRYYAPEDSDSMEHDDLGRPAGCPTELLAYDEVSIGLTLDEPPVGFKANYEITLIKPVSSYTGSSEHSCAYFTSSDVPSSIDAIMNSLDEMGIAISKDGFMDLTEDYNMIRNIITIIKVFSYGFITLISLISIANVFNTVSTNVALRRRDYAMLRSIGMTHRGMNRMMNYECLLYGSRALIIGIPIAFILTYFIYKATTDVMTIGFMLPWTAVIIAVLSVFSVVFCSMLYSTGKLKKDNPMDALKDENI